ncbi:hypothetical protein EJ640_11100, partial [Pseudomonas aeruginosa]
MFQWYCVHSVTFPWGGGPGAPPPVFFWGVGAPRVWGRPGPPPNPGGPGGPPPGAGRGGGGGGG